VAGHRLDTVALHRSPKRTRGAERWRYREPTVGPCALLRRSRVPTPRVPGARLDALALRRSTKRTRGAERGLTGGAEQGRQIRRPRAALLTKTLDVPDNALIEPIRFIVSHVNNSTAWRCAARRSGWIWSGRACRSLQCLRSECAENLGRRAIHLFAMVARVCDPIAGVPLVGCAHRQIYKWPTASFI